MSKRYIVSYFFMLTSELIKRTNIGNFIVYWGLYYLNRAGIITFK